MSFTAKDEGSPSTPQQYQDYDMSFIDNPRRPKFSKEELEALVEGVGTHRDILIPPNGTPAYRSTNNARQTCWKDIMTRVNAAADSDVVRTLPEVVKRWRYLKSRTRVKARRVARSDKSLSDIQKRVMEIAGEKENAPVEGYTDNGEDGWDEVYEIDVGDVTVGDIYEDGYDEHETPATNQPSSVRYVTTDASVIKSQQIAQSTPPNHVVNNVSQHAIQTSEVSSLPIQSAAPLRLTRNNSNFEQAPHSSRHYERAPPPMSTHSTNHIIRTENERHDDKNNVNITVQSCSCHHSNQSKTVDEQRLEIEKERLGVERQRLEVEKQRLEIERERLEIEKKRKEVAGGVGC